MPRYRDERVGTRRPRLILFWLSGGPSHIDMWDPKPDAPSEIRGPFSHIPTKLPGVHELVSERLTGSRVKNHPVWQTDHVLFFAEVSVGSRPHK